jgi:hypothetical protein
VNEDTRRALRRAVLQGLGVFVGILAALFADAWWDGMETRGRERRYLASLAQDFAENEERLTNAVARGDTVVIASLALLDVRTPERAHVLGTDSLSALVRTLSDLPTFEPVTRTWDNILGAGDLLTLRDEELRMLLADFHSRLLLMNVVQETQEKQYVGLFQPFVVEHLDYLAVVRMQTPSLELPVATEPEIIQSAVGSRRFRNWVVVRLGWADDLRDQHREVLAKVEEIRGLLSSPETGISP